MGWLFENPLPAVLMGGLTVAMLGSGWLRTGQKWLLYLMVVVILLTVGAVVLERMVVTDREQIERTLHEIADLVEQNRIDAALEYAYSGSPEIREQAITELGSYRFHRIDIKRNLKIEVFPDHIPPKATAEFNVLVVFSTKDGFLNQEYVLRFVEVTFYREDDGQWRAAEYHHYPPNRAYQRRSIRTEDIFPGR